MVAMQPVALLTPTEGGNVKQASTDPGRKSLARSTPEIAVIWVEGKRHRLAMGGCERNGLITLEELERGRREISYLLTRKSRGKKNHGGAFNRSLLGNVNDAE